MSDLIDLVATVGLAQIAIGLMIILLLGDICRHLSKLVKK